MKNSSDTIGSRTLDLTAYSAVPQPAAPLRARPNQESAVYFRPFSEHSLIILAR